MNSKGSEADRAPATGRLTLAADASWGAVRFGAVTATQIPPPGEAAIPRSGVLLPLVATDTAADGRVGILRGS